MQLTEKRTRKNKKGVEIDSTIYLERLDSNNLVIKEGENILAYYGDVRTALRRSLNYAIKGSTEALSLETIVSAVKRIDEAINKLKNNVM